MYKVRWVLVWLLIGQKTGERFLSQSVSVAIAYYFDSHLKTALNNFFLHCVNYRIEAAIIIISCNEKRLIISGALW